MGSLKVGIGQVDITPEPGLPLTGNFRDDYAARGKHDPLLSRAMVIDNGRETVALVSVDICMLKRDNVSKMRQWIHQITQIPQEHILIAATHTHSGPSAFEIGSMPGSDPQAVDEILKKASSAVGLACGQLKESRLAIGTAMEDRLSFNRRLACKDGKTHMNWEGLDPEFVEKPLGPKDPQVVALSVHQGDGPKGVAVNFALHPAILAGDNWLYSADYPGYLAEAMSRVMGHNFTSVFFTGCCGNVNHIDYEDKLQGRGYMMAQRVGYMLACAVQEAVKGSEFMEDDTLGVSREMVPLKRLKISEEDRRWSDQVIAEAEKTGSKGQVDGLPDEFFALRWLEMYRNQDQDDQVEVMVVRIGDLGIVGIPGEAFCEFGLSIKQQSPAKQTMVIDLANDAAGYLPTMESFAQGGYEPMVGSTVYQPGSGEKLVDSAVNQLKKLFKS